MKENNKAVEFSIKLNSDGTYEVEGEVNNKVRENLIKLFGKELGLLVIPTGVCAKPAQEVLSFFFPNG